MSQIPPFPQDSATPAQQPSALVCPKCRGTMRTYDRNGIHVEQCETCRGFFLDFGEFEALARLEANVHAAAAAPPAPAPQPAPGYQTGYPSYGPEWGYRGGHHYRKRGLSGLFFSS
ncbi:MAG TPA: zf-TFIIB domain-containing protein [Dermatophilaceae bacterium]|nr:zf-TFIIB domain-containing protein [Dermatophilaceae bacterium]